MNKHITRAIVDGIGARLRAELPLETNGLTGHLLRAVVALDAAIAADHGDADHQGRLRWWKAAIAERLAQLREVDRG
jgi:hypothetical protein